MVDYINKWGRRANSVCSSPSPGETERNPTPYVQRLPSEDDSIETGSWKKTWEKLKWKDSLQKYTTSIPENCQDHPKQETAPAKRRLRAQDKCNPWHPGTEKQEGHHVKAKETGMKCGLQTITVYRYSS